MAAARSDTGIEYRRQWGHGGGYCGECSLQTIALKVSGMYVSQERIRRYADNRELLVGPPSMWGTGSQDAGHYAGHLAAEKLNLAYEIFPTDQLPEPQQEAYYHWCKSHVKAGHYPIICFSYGGGREPVIKMSPGGIPTQADYNHIVNLSGVTEFDGKSWKNDILIIHEHFDDMPLSFPMRYMHGKDAEVHPDSELFPGFFRRCYGMTILGKQSVVPGEADIVLTVKNEGDWRYNLEEAPFEEPRLMHAILQISNLVPGAEYRIERSKPRNLKVGLTFTLDSGVEVVAQQYFPKTDRWRLETNDGKIINAFDIELAMWEPCFEFVATEEQVTWKDDEQFLSNGYRKYRCLMNNIEEEIF